MSKFTLTPSEQKLFIEMMASVSALRTIRIRMCGASEAQSEKLFEEAKQKKDEIATVAGKLFDSTEHYWSVDV